MIRSFHPIGQGAFYTEQFDDFTIVYDCGSGTNVSVIESEIRSVFNENQKIDAVFISHLHDDHVNGLEYLINYCNVKKLFLPLLHDEEKIDLLIQNGIDGGPIPSFLTNLIINPSIEGVNVILVPKSDGDSKIDIEGESIVIDEKSNINTKSLEYNPKLTYNATSNWVFIPFNFRNDARSAELIKKLTYEGINLNTIEEFKNNWEDIIIKSKIISIYKSIPGSMNANSMTLYSGPKNDNCVFHHVFPLFHYSHFHRLHHWLIGCLYFGDYEASGARKWSQFNNFYQNFWDKVGTVQIPHHGSRHNYNDEINMGNPKFSIISSGYSNRYRHPHGSTLRRIMQSGSYPMLVNEKAGSRVIFEID
jgi:hypothetical protein